MVFVICSVVIYGQPVLVRDGIMEYQSTEVTWSE